VAELLVHVRQQRLHRGCWTRTVARVQHALDARSTQAHGSSNIGKAPRATELDRLYARARRLTEGPHEPERIKLSNTLIVKLSGLTEYANVATPLAEHEPARRSVTFRYSRVAVLLDIFGKVSQSAVPFVLTTVPYEPERIQCGYTVQAELASFALLATHTTPAPEFEASWR
jgi:hypothetical protein